MDVSSFDPAPLDSDPSASDGGVGGDGLDPSSMDDAPIPGGDPIDESGRDGPIDLDDIEDEIDGDEEFE